MSNSNNVYIETTLGKIAVQDSRGLVDGPFGSNLPASDYTTDGVPVIRGSNLSLGMKRFIDDEFVFVSEETAKRLERSICRPDDIVFTKKGTLGQTGIIPRNHIYSRFLISSNQMKLTVDTEIADPLYVYYYVSSPQSVEKLIRDAESTGVPKTNLAYLKTFPITLPPLPLQREIAHILGSLDEKIDLNRRMNATLESMARALFKSWFVDFDPVRAKAEGRQPDGIDADTAAIFPDAFEDSALGPIPTGWRICELKECCRQVENGGTPRRDNPEYWENGSISWLTSGEVRQAIVLETSNFITASGLNHSSAKLWPKGTTVVAMYGATAGEVTLLANQMSSNQACCGLVPKEDMIYFNYLAISSASKSLAGMARGSAQQNLSQGIIAQYRVVVPTPSLLNLFEHLTLPIFEQWTRNLKEIGILAATRDALLPRLMSGEIEIN